MKFGLDSVYDYIRVMPAYTLARRIDRIACPTLVCSAEDHMLSQTAQLVYDGLQCPKCRAHFTVAEGAGGHCEMLMRTRWAQRAFDWLDE